MDDRLRGHDEALRVGWTGRNGLDAEFECLRAVVKVYDDVGHGIGWNPASVSFLEPGDGAHFVEGSLMDERNAAAQSHVVEIAHTPCVTEWPADGATVLCGVRTASVRTKSH